MINEIQCNHQQQYKTFRRVPVGRLCGEGNTILSNKSIGIEIDHLNSNYPVSFFGYNTIESPTGAPRNAFYNLNKAIESNGARYLKINSNDITSSQSVTTASNNGNMGINIVLAEAVDINITNNNVYNNRLAINVYEDGSYNSFGTMVVNSNNNTISATNPNITTAAPNNYVYWGILTSSTASTLGYLNTRTANCNNNILSDVQNGIVMNNWQGVYTHTDYNSISLKLDPAAVAGIEYYGIWLASGIPVDENPIDPITGLPKTSGYEGNTVTGNTVAGNSDQQSQIGIFTQQQYGTNYGCNTVSNTEHATKFNDMCFSTVFWDNWLDISNQYGFTLSQAIIGMQGTPNIHGNGACPSNNHWSGTNTQWQTNYSIPHWKTFNDNSFNVNSPFVVKSTSVEFNPNGCGAVDLSQLVGQIVFPYQHTTGTSPTATNTLLYATTLQSDCNRCTGGFSRMASSEEEDNIETLEQIADESINLPSDDANMRLYNLQQQLYDILQAKPDLKVKSSELQSFAQANNWTVFDYIHYTGKYLAADDAATADMLLNYWPTTTKELDNNYYTYYNWITNMKLDKTYTPNLGNVLALANKCPQKSGKVVYAARALYNGLTKTVNRFTNDCSGGLASRKNNSKIVNAQSKITNTLTTYPNPTNDGIINIQLEESSVKEAGKWFVIITNIYGKPILTQALTGLKTQLNLGTAKGIYFANIHNNVNGKHFVNKIILE